MAGTAWQDYSSDFGDQFGPGFDSSNQTLIFPTSNQPVGQPEFDIPFEATVSCLYWVLLLWQGGYAGLHVWRGDAPRLKRWPLYFMTLAHVLLSCLAESIAWGYSAAAAHDKAKDATYLAYIFFWHASSASFLVLLLALSSGYCITHGDLDGLKGRVYGIPAIVFIAGVASDFTFVYVESTQSLSAAADRYDIVQMSPTEEAVWFLGSLANIMCFILAWIYVFDSTQLEVRALDEAQLALQRKPEEEQQAAANGSRNTNNTIAEEDDSDNEDANGRPGRGGRPGSKRPGAPGQRSLGTVSQRTGLLYGMEDSTGAASARRNQDVEQPQEPAEQETLADRMEYTIRKKLLMRFYYGVCGYLVASMMVILLPAFFNNVVQNVLVVLQFIVKYLFTLVLVWLFRPAENSPYLQLGLSENETDELGLGQLDTELAVTDHASRPAGGPAVTPGASGAVPSWAAGSSSMAAAGSSAAAAPSLPISTMPGIGPQPAQAHVSRVGRGGYATLPPNAEASQGSAAPKFTLTDDD